MNKKSSASPWLRRIFALVAIVGLPAIASAASDYLLQIDSVSKGESVDSNPNNKIEIVSFHWGAGHGAMHTLQSSPDLVQWTTVDSFLPSSDGTITDQIFLAPGTPRLFLRIVLPQVQINSIQPSFISTSGGSFFLIGQLFAASDTVRIDGNLVSSTFIDSNTFMVNAGPLSAGFHTITLLDGTNTIIATFTNGLFVNATGRTDQESPPSAPLVNDSVTFSGGPGAEPEESCGDTIRRYEWDLNYQTHVALPPVIVPPGFAAGSEIFTDKYSRIKVQFHWDREGNKDSDSSCWIRVRPLDPIPRPSEVDSFFDIFYRVDLNGLNAGNVKVHPLFGVPRINEATGELFVGSVDLRIPGRGGLDLVWARTYRSKSGMDTPMGTGWDFSYNIRATQSGTNITVQDGQNRTDTYFLQSDGSFSCDELFRRGTLTGNVFTLQFADKTSWVFKPLDSSLISGKIDRIIDRNSNQLQFFYNPGTGQLVQIMDTLGRPFQISYDGAGRIQFVQDFSGRQLVYQHYVSGPGGSIGDLMSVRSPVVTGTPTSNDFPAGKTAQFTYSAGFPDAARNHNLLTARDGNNVPWFQASYTTTSLTSDLLYDRVANETIGTAGETTVLTYLAQTPSVANRFATTKAIVNDAVGNVHESLFDGKNRLIDLRQFTGRSTPGIAVTESTNRPSGQVRASDPAFFKTTIDWNRDSLPARVTWPRSNVDELVYQRDFDPNTSPGERANLRVHREIPLSGPPIVQRLGHQPGFGTGEFLQFHFGTVFTTKIDWSGPGDEGPEESITFVYGKLGVHYTKQVDNDEAVTIRHDRTETVGKDEMITVHGSRNETVGKDDTISVHTNRTETVGKDESITVGGSPTRTVGKNESISVQGNRTETVDRNETITIHGFRTSYVDGRGFTWGCARDPNGNAIGLTRPDGVATTYEYNANGQLTAVVRPQNNTGHQERDEWHYYTSPPQTGYLQTFVRDVGGLNLTTGYQYDSLGNLVQLTDPRGTATQFAVNQLNQIVQITFQSAAPSQTPVPYLRSVFYDANNRVTSIDVQNKDEFGNVGSNASFTTSFIYDSLDRRTSMTQEVDVGHTVTTQYFYDADGNLTEVRSPLAVSSVQPDARVQYVYDERNLPFTSTDAPGSAIATRATYTYDANGNLTKLETGAPTGSLHTTIYAYDGFDRLIQRTDPVGTQYQFTYNGNDQLLTTAMQGHLLDASGNPIFGPLRSATYTYDSRGVLTQSAASWFDPITSAVVGDGARTTIYAYDPFLNLTTLTDDNGHSTLYSYDGANRLSRITDPKLNRVDYTYDANGNLVTRSHTDKSDLGASDQVFTITYAYDGLNRATTATDNVGNMGSYFYDSRSNLVRTIDARNDLAQYEYDGLGRLTRRGHDLAGNSSAFDAGDIVHTYAWDDNSRLLGRTDPNNHSTQYVYDPLGRVTRRNNADTTFETWGYDAWGNTIQSNDENGTVCINTYDNLNRLTQRQVTAGAGVSTATTLEMYDYPGDYRVPIRAIDDAAVTRFTYDSLGRLTTERLSNRVTTYTYDGVGNLLTLQSPGGRVTTYSYDAANHCNGLSLTATSDGDALGQMAAYDYVGDRLEFVSHRNGTLTTYTYDGFVGAPSGADRGWGKLASSATLGPGGTVLDQRTFTYDAAQNLMERHDTRVGGPQFLYHYDYDRADRDFHTQVSAGGPVLRNTTYTYDLNGNRITVNGVGTPNPGSYSQDATTPAPADAQMNQYTTTPLGSYLYDANGNRTNLNGGGGNTSYKYDYADRLIDLTNVSTGLRIANYQYDALGRRIQKTLDPDGTPNVINFFYSGGAVLEERDGAGAISAAYSFASRLMEEEGIYYFFRHQVQSPDEVSGYVVPEPPGKKPIRPPDTLEGTVIDPPVEMRRGGNNFTIPRLSNIWLIMNASGAAVERYDYDDFRSPLDGSGAPLSSSAVGNPYLFKGMRFDAESGLYCITKTVDCASPSFFNFDPKIGATLQREPSHAVNAWSMDVKIEGQNVYYVDPWVWMGTDGWVPIPIDP